MIRRILLACAVASALAPAAGRAEHQPCATGILEKLGAHVGLANFYPRDGSPDGRIVASACRPRPSSARGMVVAAAYDEGREAEKRVIVAVIEDSRSRVVGVHQRVVQEEAGLRLGEGSLRLDTAPYVLAPGVRAFGLDLQGVTEYAGCVEGGLGPMRTLYALDATGLRPVLEDFFLSRWTFVEGGPVCTDNRKVIENTDYTIAIAPTRTRGLADLRIAARVTYDDPARAPRKMRIWTLKYDGTRYPMNPSIHPMNGEPPARTP